MSEEAWTRATTIANTLEDRFGLERWNQRNIILGLGQREDLYALAQSSTPEDKGTLNGIAAQALEASKARSSANLGTALHRILERLDRGEDWEVPASWQEDVDAYYAAITNAHITIDPHWIERVVVVPSIRVAGTLDRLATVFGETSHRVADFKSGHNAVKYGAHDIAVQLGIYASATHAWKGSASAVPRDQYGRYVLPDPDEEPDAYEPMPPVDTDSALIIHLPVGTGECAIYSVDIKAGMEAIRLAMDVRAWRKRDDLLSTFTPIKEVIAAADTDDDDW